ncbi:MAG TPA: histidinol dehydrogenase, partial [Spirochaetia bacterium]|nr:histidinol dehydrogenase [Spirochaetia bacterium]
MKDIQIKQWESLTHEERTKILSRSEADISSIVEKVRPIVDEVRTRGDRALIDLTRKFDHVELSGRPLLVTEEEFSDAEKIVPDDVRT